MSLVTKPSGRRSTDTAVGLIVHNYPEYPENEEDVHPSHKSQRAGLIAKKAPTKIPAEYADFAFFSDLASKLPEHTGLNDYAIKLVEADGFIRPSKLPAGTPIFFDRKSNGSLRLYVDYRGPYNVLDHVGFDGQGSFEGHDRSYVPRQAGKGLILSGNLFVG